MLLHLGQWAYHSVETYLEDPKQGGEDFGGNVVVRDETSRVSHNLAGLPGGLQRRIEASQRVTEGDFTDGVRGSKLGTL